MDNETEVYDKTINNTTLKWHVIGKIAANLTFNQGISPKFVMEMTKTKFAAAIDHKIPLL